MPTGRPMPEGLDVNAGNGKKSRDSAALGFVWFFGIVWDRTLAKMLAEEKAILSYERIFFYIDDSKFIGMKVLDGGASWLANPNFGP